MKQFIFLLLVCIVVKSEKILVFFYFPSVSHQNVLRPIVEELSLRGHEVTFVTPNPKNDSSFSKITQIDVSVGYDAFKLHDGTKFNRDSVNLIQLMIWGDQFYYDILSRQLESKGVKELLNKPADSFDLILIEGNTAAYFGLQHKFKAPLIVVSSYSSGGYYHHIFGNPDHPVLYPDVFSEHIGPITNMLDKIDSLYFFLTSYLMSRFYYFPNMDKLVRPYFGNDMPYIEDLMRNTSLMMLNVNPIISERRPLAPNVIYFYKVHLTKKTPLPQDLQEILDNSKNGVVYFSLGTNVRFEYVEGNFKKTILEALGGLPYTVICKWEANDFPGRPKNVILRKWLPQQSILAHPNIKVFVTQGGLQSIEEAISNAIPLVVIPFLGDQPMNGRILASRGMAEVIMPKSINKDILRNTILKVAQNEKYHLKAQELRDIFEDQPESGMDKVIWWCEYVIRHKGAPHLRSPSADISLYEYFMLDVLILVLVVLFATYKSLCLIIRTSMKFLRNSNTHTKIKHKKQ